MPEHVLAPVRRPFRAMAQTFVPEAAELTPQQWARAEAAVETSLAPRPAEMKRQLRLFLRVVQWGSVGRFGRTFTSLDSRRRSSFLRALERAPLLAVRRGVWGVRTLSFMAVYGLPEIRRAIGYRADPGGWEARRTPADPGDRTPPHGDRIGRTGPDASSGSGRRP